jgi:hypothetical protein
MQALEATEEKPVQPLLIAVRNIKTPFHDMLRAKEADKIIPELLKVEDMFIEHINQENLEHSYDEIYEHFNKEFLRAANYVVNKFQPKHVMVNGRYFQNKYKSKES